MYSAVQEVICPKRSLEILTMLTTDGERNFSDIESELPTSSDVVSNRLQTLAEYGLVDRQERSARDVRYSLTDKGSMVLDQVDELESLLAP